MNRKTIKKLVLFIGIMVLCTISGFLFGRWMRMLRDDGMDLERMMQAVRSAVAVWLPGIYILLSLLTFLLSAAVLGYTGKEAKAWDGEDEEVIDRIERRLYLPNIVSGTMLILNFLFFPIAVYLDHAVTLCEICFIVTMVWVFTVNGLLIRLERTLNPEKKGSILDFNFTKKWEKSCDEAQKWILYQAGYRAYIVTNFVCMIFWVIAFIGMLLFQTGILALVAICGIWLSAVLTYVITGMKLEGKR